MAPQDKKQKLSSSLDASTPPDPSRLDTSEWQSFPVLTAVSLVCRERLPAHGDESILRAIDSFLDELSRSWTLPSAYEHSGGRLRLLQYLAVREPRTMDTYLRRWGVNMVTGQAAARGDLQTLKWVAESYLPDEFLTEVVSEAASNGHLEIVKWLWDNHRSMGYWGGIELCGALRKRQFGVVEWLRDNVVIGNECAQYVVKQAAASGNLEFVQRLYDHFDVGIVDAVATAARSHQWKVVRWCLDNANRDDLDAALYEDDIYISPAQSGNLDMLKFLFDRGLVRDLEAVLHVAAARGHLDIIKWLHEEKGVEHAGDGYILAAENGKLDVLKYFQENDLDSATEHAIVDAAAHSGSLETLQWVHLNTDAQCTNRAMDEAARHGNLEMLKWLHENRTEGCSAMVMHFAAQHGHLNTVKWLHANRNEGCHAATMKMVAERGNLEMLQWLHDNRDEDFELDGVMDNAAAHGRLNILQWFHENYNRGCSTVAMDQASANGHLEVVKWLHEHREEGCTQRAMDGAAKNGHLDVVQWLHANRNEGCTTMAIDGAAANSHLKVVKWLHYYRSEMCTSLAIEWLFSKSARLDTAGFLFSEFPECRTFHLGVEFEVAWLEVVQWLLECAPSALEGCTLKVKSWNWFVCDWLQQNNWKQVEREGVFSRWERSMQDA